MTLIDLIEDHPIASALFLVSLVSSVISLGVYDSIKKKSAQQPLQATASTDTYKTDSSSPTLENIASTPIVAEEVEAKEEPEEKKIEEKVYPVSIAELNNHFSKYSGERFKLTAKIAQYELPGIKDKTCYLFLKDDKDAISAYINIDTGWPQTKFSMLAKEAKENKYSVSIEGYTNTADGNEVEIKKLKICNYTFEGQEQ